MPLRYELKRDMCDILIVSFSGNLQDDDLRTFKDVFNHRFIECEKLPKRERSFSLIIDMRDVSAISPNLIIDLARYMSECEPLINKYLVSSSIIVSNEWIKTIINMFFTIRKPTKPNCVTTTYELAYEFIKDYSEIYSLGSASHSSSGSTNSKKK